MEVASKPKGIVDHRSIAILGLVTICAYGSWYYAFGVLLDPIRLDTGWSESSLASSFSAGTVIIGLTSIGGGRLLDRVGHQRVFALGGIIGGGGLLLASTAENIFVFTLGAALGLGAFGAFGFYHVTMTTAVRLNPDEPKRAIAELTLWGALASAIFLPLTAWMVDALDWRSTVRVLGLVATLVMVAAAALLPGVEPEQASNGNNVPTRLRLGQVIRGTVAGRGPRSFTIAVAFGGIALSTMLVYQVPVMTAAGLPAVTAATMAGVRGFAQIGGRAPLAPIVNRLGSDGALVLAFVAIAVGGAILAVAGTIGVGIVFALIAGFGIGAFSPLQGMKAEELFTRSELGATMGFYSSVLLLVGSIGPVSAGILAERTGERRWVSLIIVGSAMIAAAAIRYSGYRRDDE